MLVFNSCAKQAQGRHANDLTPTQHMREQPHFPKINVFTRDLDERRKLRHELGPAYRPLMGTTMGHFELDLAKPMHQLAARKVRRKTGTASHLEKI